MEGRERSKGGHCLVAWSTVTKPKEMGGLRIAYLKTLGRVLRVRWLWLKKLNLGHPSLCRWVNVWGLSSLWQLTLKLGMGPIPFLGKIVGSWVSEFRILPH
jgi:hypothetical protein